MKLSRHDKVLLFEQEFATLFFMVLLGLLFHFQQYNGAFYLLALNVGFIFYFWMVHEENVHSSGEKHRYFEHTSSFIMVGQTALALQLVSLVLGISYLFLLCMIVSVIMYSIALARIALFKVVFKDHHILARPATVARPVQEPVQGKAPARKAKA